MYAVLQFCWRVRFPLSKRSFLFHATMWLINIAQQSVRIHVIVKYGVFRDYGSVNHALATTLRYPGKPQSVVPEFICFRKHNMQTRKCSSKQHIHCSATRKTI